MVSSIASRQLSGCAVLCALVLLCFNATAAAQAPQGPGGGQAGGRGPSSPPMTLTSGAWEDGGVIPNKYTQATPPGTLSPGLNWSEAPTGTLSLVLILHDTDGAMNKSPKMDVTHWLVWNIPGSSTALPENLPPGDLPDGTRQISLRSTGYMGPGFPGPSYHHYMFELYALDTMLTVAAGTPERAADTRVAVFNAMDGHVLGKAVLFARFHR